VAGPRRFAGLKAAKKSTKLGWKRKGKTDRQETTCSEGNYDEELPVWLTGEWSLAAPSSKFGNQVWPNSQTANERNS